MKKLQEVREKIETTLCQLVSMVEQNEIIHVEDTLAQSCHLEEPAKLIEEPLKLFEEDYLGEEETVVPVVEKENLEPSYFEEQPLGEEHEEEKEDLAIE